MSKPVLDRHEGEWLCPKGPYLDKIKAMSAFDPRLRSRDSKAVKQGTKWPMESVRIVNMHLDDVNNTFQQTHEWTDAADLLRSLDTDDAFSEGKRNVLLVEGLTPPLINVLGTKCDIHPSFFVDYERVTVFDDVTTFLPSRNRSAATQGSAMLRYVEPLSFEKGMPDFYMSCADSGRHIGVTRIQGKISSTGLLRRKCSYWRSTNGLDGFTIIVLCDPPLRRVRNRHNMRPGEFEPVVTNPYRGGYFDFLPQEGQMSAQHGPSRISLLDDLRYYLAERRAAVSHVEPAARVTFLLHKLVAAHYLQLSSFSSTTLSSQQWDLTRKEDMETAALNQVEQQWSDVQGLERRLNEYCNDLGDIMLKLGVQLQDPDTSQCNGVDAWTRTDIDFQFLRMHFQNLRHRAEQLNAATTGLTGIAGNRQSQREQRDALREAQRTKALTLVGLVFIPLAYTATLFSMNERYMPGAEQFWVYFSVAVPLIVAVVLGYLVLDKAYDQRTWERPRDWVVRLRRVRLGRLRREGKKTIDQP